MFGNRHFDRVRAMFADQFEPDGTDFLYRKSMKGPPIRVSGAERDAFIADFRRRLRLVIWGMVGAIVPAIAILAFLFPDEAGPARQFALYAMGGAFIALFFLAFYWAWYVPSRDMQRRPAVGEARSRAEMRKIGLARIRYSQLGFAAAAGALFLGNAADRHDIRHGWGRLWIAAFAAFLGLILVQLLRKWRSER